jgi:hypothetical protein
MTAPRSSSNAAAQQQPEFQYRIPVFSLLLAGPPTSPGGIVLHHSLVGWPSFTFIDMSNRPLRKPSRERFQA